jgi:hypothetical protein
VRPAAVLSPAAHRPGGGSLPRGSGAGRSGRHCSRRAHQRSASAIVARGKVLARAAALACGERAGAHLRQGRPVLATAGFQRAVAVRHLTETYRTSAPSCGTGLATARAPSLTTQCRQQLCRDALGLSDALAGALREVGLLGQLGESFPADRDAFWGLRLPAVHIVSWT